MCLHQPVIANLSQWNWDGDRIIHDSIVPSSRLPIGRKGGGQYDIDVREFLITENNAIMKRTLRENLPCFLKEINESQAKFTERGKGAFDFRAHIIAAYITEKIRYVAKKGRDPWQFPDETLFLGSGDCEDIAFLLASLLLASGVSPYNVRVVLGKVRTRTGTKRQTYDHMWVMYKSESGTWLLLEPLHLNTKHPPIPQEAGQSPASTIKTKNRKLQLEYIPHFMFNSDHLWIIGADVEESDFRKTVSRAWRKLNPKFVGEVHQTIINQALQDIAPKYVLDALNRHFGRILGLSPVIDDIDNFLTHGYDSRDHFDNGFIAESWQRVIERLAKFQENNNDLDSFAYAAHGIADFYAHSSYLHFAKITNGTAHPYDPDNPNDPKLFENLPSYNAGSGFDLETGAFSINQHVFSGTKKQAAAFWKDRIISGRYAQKGDSKSTLERLTFIPKPLLGADFTYRGGLPHHNEIAVDDTMFETGHKLYKNKNVADPSDRLAFSNQFNWRKDTAIKHIRQVFKANWKTIQAPNN